MKNNVGIYIHIPFCQKKCDYCDFYSLTYNDNLVNNYIDALCENFAKYSGESADTIYFGGGTPTLLSIKNLKKINSNLINNFNLIEPEITIEANPNTVDIAYLKELRKIGFNRISFGVQSFDDTELQILGRTHTADGAKSAILQAFDAGFRNISADIMLAIPNQTEKSLFKTLETLVELPITHVSAYILKIEENTPFNSADIINKLPTEDFFCDSYLKTIDFLKKHGYEQYEISNFAKKNLQSVHNLKYWKSEEYLGFGPSAHSFFNGKRFCNERNLQKYILEKGNNPVVTEDNPRTFEEFSMLKLRLCEGLSFNELKTFGKNDEEFINKAQPYIKAGLINILNDRIALTKEGFLLSNQVIGKLIFA